MPKQFCLKQSDHESNDYKDFERSTLKWYTASAEAGEPWGMYYLGKFYSTIDHECWNSSMAKFWLEKAIEADTKGKVKSAALKVLDKVNYMINGY